MNRPHPPDSLEGNAMGSACACERGREMGIERERIKQNAIQDKTKLKSFTKKRLSKYKHSAVRTVSRTETGWEDRRGGVHCDGDRAF